MTIRATDYAPAVELEFEDVIEALLVADRVVAPDDPHGYRDSVAAAFAAFGIVPPAGADRRPRPSSRCSTRG